MRAQTFAQLKNRLKKIYPGEVYAEGAEILITDMYTLKTTREGTAIQVEDHYSGEVIQKPREADGTIRMCSTMKRIFRYK